jgi:hypothetical protein
MLRCSFPRNTRTLPEKSYARRETERHWLLFSAWPRELAPIAPSCLPKTRPRAGRETSTAAKPTHQLDETAKQADRWLVEQQVSRQLGHPSGVPQVRCWECPASNAGASPAVVLPEPACHAGVAPARSKTKKMPTHFQRSRQPEPSRPLPSVARRHAAGPHDNGRRHGTACKAAAAKRARRRPAERHVGRACAEARAPAGSCPPLRSSSTRAIPDRAVRSTSDLSSLVQYARAERAGGTERVGTALLRSRRSRHEPLVVYAKRLSRSRTFHCPTKEI